MFLEASFHPKFFQDAQWYEAMKVYNESMKGGVHISEVPKFSSCTGLQMYALTISYHPLDHSTIGVGLSSSIYYHPLDHSTIGVGLSSSIYYHLFDSRK